MFAELGDVRERSPSDARLAAETGVAPLTYQSGKSRSVTFRWACNHRLRRAITCFADNSRHASQWAARVYTAARLRGFVVGEVAGAVADTALPCWAKEPVVQSLPSQHLSLTL